VVPQIFIREDIVQVQGATPWLHLVYLLCSRFRVLHDYSLLRYSIAASARSYLMGQYPCISAASNHVFQPRPLSRLIFLGFMTRLPMFTVAMWLLAWLCRQVARYAQINNADSMHGATVAKYRPAFTLCPRSETAKIMLKKTSGGSK